MAQTLIQVKDLKKYYNGGDVKALDGVTVDVYKGDVIAVIGPSGGGKSTFLRDPLLSGQRGPAGPGQHFPPEPGLHSQHAPGPAHPPRL